MAGSDSTNAPGRPWTIVGTFSTYEAASAKAAQHKGSRNVEVKIKQLSTGFTVRTRQEERAASPVHQESAPSGAVKKTKMKAKERRALERSASAEDSLDSPAEKTS